MDQIPAWAGTQVADRDGVPVGIVRDVFFGEADSRPAWLLVDAGGRLAFVPMRSTRSRLRTVAVPFSREEIAASPAVAPHARLHGEPLLRLARHYGVGVDRFGGCAGVHGGPAVRLAA